MNGLQPTSAWGSARLDRGVTRETFAPSRRGPRDHQGGPLVPRLDKTQFQPMTTQFPPNRPAESRLKRAFHGRGNGQTRQDPAV